MKVILECLVRAKFNIYVYVLIDHSSHNLAPTMIANDDNTS
jgi:hypothetical protein